KDLGSRFEEWLELESLEAQLLGDGEEALASLESSCSNAVGRLVDDLEVQLTLDVDVVGFQFTDWRKALTALRHTLQIGGLLFKLAKLTKWGKRLGTASGPVGWVVLVGTEVLGQTAKRFP